MGLARTDLVAVLAVVVLCAGWVFVGELSMRGGGGYISYPNLTPNLLPQIGHLITRKISLPAILISAS